MDVHDSTTIPTGTIERFYAKVDRSGGPDSCWLWTGRARDRGGYGGMRVAGKSYRAHRLAHLLFNGPIPPGQVVMHACDNPPCCNPAHLRAGTVADNNHDMIAKGRDARGERNGTLRHWDQRARGERHGRSKLTQANVDAILAPENRNVPRTMWAKLFGVDPTTISRVVHAKSWPDSQPGGVIRAYARTQQEARP